MFLFKHEVNMAYDNYVSLKSVIYRQNKTSKTSVCCHINKAHGQISTLKMNKNKYFQLIKYRLRYFQQKSS